MKLYTKNDLLVFLRAVDKHMSEEFKLVVIGGSAATLAFRSSKSTKDIDTFNDPSPIERACAAARDDTGLDVPLEMAGVADAPYEYESRLQRLKVPGLKWLKIWVPEKHDLALMKIIRGYENDLMTVKELKQRQGLDLEVLLKRFRKEMGHIIHDPDRLRLNLLSAIEFAFGPEEAKHAAKRLPGS